MKFYLLFASTLLSLALSGQNTATVLTGQVKDEAGEGLIGATVKVLKAGTLVRGTITDYEGNYRINLEPGTYDIEVLYTGFTTEKISGVQLQENKINRLDVTMKNTAALQEVVIKEFKVPLIQQDATTTGHTISSCSGARNLPTREVNAIVGASSGKSGKRKKDEVQIRGSRSNNTNYYIDGIRVQGGATQQPNSPTAQQPTDPSQGEGYASITDNAFQFADKTPVSTFSIDVDGAAYANVRRFLNQGQLPPKDAVRIEEMINYFDYQYPQPTDGKPFAVQMEMGACPWNKQHSLLMIGIQGRDIDAGQLPPSNFVFLVDVSGSMSSADKLPLLQQSLTMLTDHLRPQDRVALVVYAGAAGLVLPSTPGSDKTKIKDAIQRLSAGGSTAGAEGIQLAYQTARENFQKNGNNRVVLCTDGDFNVGVSSDEELVKLIEKERESGVFLTVLGFGTGNYQDGKMQQLSNKGNGNHAYIDQIGEAQKVLIEEFGGTMFAIAKDVKLQLEFNPTRVAGYRLIGYENRLLNKEDFDDDTKDAGELGAGHRVTALYEVIPAGGEVPVADASGALVYQNTVAKKPLSTDQVCTLKLRYKEPKVGAASKLIETSVTDKVEASPSENFRLAAAIACFGMLLRESPYKSGATYDAALELARSAAGHDPGGYRQELVGLIERVKKMKSGT